MSSCDPDWRQPLFFGALAAYFGAPPPVAILIGLVGSSALTWLARTLLLMGGFRRFGQLVRIRLQNGNELLKFLSQEQIDRLMRDWSGVASPQTYRFSDGSEWTVDPSAIVSVSFRRPN